MKHRIVYILCLLAVFYPGVNASGQADFCNQTSVILGKLNKYHYTPIVLNEITSTEIFNNFLEHLDPNNSIFTSADISYLKPYETQLLSLTSNEQVCAFLHTIAKLYLYKLQRVDTIISSILQKPFDYSVKDSITFTNTYKANFAANDKELKNRWVRWLKYQTLNMMFTPVGDDDPYKMDVKQLLKNEADIRKKVGIKRKRMLQRIMEHPSGYEAYVAELFFNTIANRYDPHTLYLSPAGNESFRAALSKEAKSFGLSFAEGKNGDVEIGILTPGGPAWKSNQLHTGDVLVQVKWPEQEAIDLTCSSSIEVDQIINNSGYDNLWLTIKKANGVITTVPMVKEIIDVEENTIAGYILNGEKKIGYISLPDFYTGWDTQNTRGCANDVAKEILKLQKENIQGLILDLRYNGGGSLFEALGLLGIFIDEGPLFILEKKEQKPIVMKDLNRGTVYNGPLVLMVNGFSASASELVTAGLRDYNRALIVGSNTFGKAIVQMMMPLDTIEKTSNNYSDQDSKGYLNITMEKLYRINGESHQKTGIAPDIELPDLYSNLDYGEVSESYAINSDRVDKKVYYNPLPPLPVAGLAEKSRNRTEQNHVFSSIKNLYDSLQLTKKHKEILQLNIDAYREHAKKIHDIKNTFERLSKASIVNYSVLATHFDETLVKSNNYRKEMISVLLQKIQEDIYIEEVYSIMNDLINSIKNRP